MKLRKAIQWISLTGLMFWMVSIIVLFTKPYSNSTAMIVTIVVFLLFFLHFISLVETTKIDGKEWYYNYDELISKKKEYHDAIADLKNKLVIIGEHEALKMLNSDKERTSE